MLKATFKKKSLYNISLIIVTLSAILSLMPLIFIFTNSFMSATEATARYSSQITAHNVLGVTTEHMHYVDMVFMPDVITTSAWQLILTQDPAHLRFLLNSIILTIPIVVGQLIIAPLAAYAFERTRIKHKDKLFFAYIIIMLLPMQALLVPHFIAANLLGISQSYLAIILPAIFAPFGVFLIRQQMKGLEKEMLEAAFIDGASEFSAFLHIVMPNIKSSLTALGVLAFAEAWNIVDQAVVFITNQFQMPMSVYLSTGMAGGNMGVVFALSTLFMIPALIVFIYGQDDLSEGIGYGGK